MGHRSDRTGAGRIRLVVPARAALAGNPSDGHGGAVVAVPVRRFVASVSVAPAGAGDHVPPADPDLNALIGAARAAATRLVGVPAEVLDDLTVDVRTTIPRSVGLAGSSAIVIGVLRAIATQQPDAAWSRPLSEPDVLAVVALAAEVDELGIAAGLQDRLTQAHDAPLLMTFDDASTIEIVGRPCGTAHRLPPPPGRFVLAHRPDAAGSSHRVHGDLGERTDAAATMAALAEAARDAAEAIHRGPIAALGAAMDRTFDLRAELLDLDPRHVEMVTAARQAGGHANYTGSGGAVVVGCADDRIERRVVAALADLDGCIVTPSPFEAASLSHPGAWMEGDTDPTSAND